MIKSALQWIKDQAKPPTVSVGNRDYSLDELEPVYDPSPDTLKIHTLTGLLDYCRTDRLNDLKDEKIFFQVLSPGEVHLCSELYGGFRQRDIFMTAILTEGRSFPFGSWLDPENFIIELQAKCVPDENTTALLTFINSIKEVNERVSSDDGISQTVTSKSGAVLTSESKVPNPVSLRPYRTFLEVQQPAISCVLRLRQGPQLSLHEADGGLWRLEAIKSIKAFLEQELAAMTPPQKIPVIA